MGVVLNGGMRTRKSGHKNSFQACDYLILNSMRLLRIRLARKLSQLTLRIMIFHLGFFAFNAAMAVA